MTSIIGVMLPLPFNEPFDYKTETELPLGTLVRVPWGREEQIGVVWKHGRSSELPENKIKPIIEKLDFPPLSKNLIQFVKFVAEYNLAFVGLVLKMVISVRAVFDDNQTETLYTLSGKTLAEAKLKKFRCPLACYGLAQTCALHPQRNLSGSRGRAERGKYTDNRRDFETDCPPEKEVLCRA